MADRAAQQRPAHLRSAAWLTGRAVRIGRAGFCCIASAVGCFLLVAVLGPSAMQPALPGSGPLPFALGVGPSPHLVIGGTAAGILLGTVGLALCMIAARRDALGPAKPLLVAGLLAAAAFAVLPPVGSGDHLNYAAYGRMAATGHDPYATGAHHLPGDPIADAVEPPWREEPSVYGPLVTVQQTAASWIGGTSVRVTVLVLSLTNAAAFALVAVMLYRRAANPVRAMLLWTVNPLLLFHLVSGAHNDTLGVAASVAALVVFTGGRSAGNDSGTLPSVGRSLATGALAGAGAALKLPAALAGGGPAWSVLTRIRADGFRAWSRTGPIRLAALLAGLAGMVLACFALAGEHAFDQVRRASTSVSLATPWHLVSGYGGGLTGLTVRRETVQLGSLLLMVVLTALLLRALHRTGAGGRVDEAERAGVDPAVAGAAALILAWLFAAPYALPWYDGLGWAVLALLPWSRFDWVLLARTLILSLAYLPARDPQVVKLPDDLGWLFTGVRSTIAPWLLTGLLIVLILTCRVRHESSTKG